MTTIRLVEALRNWIKDNGELTTDQSKTSQKTRPKYAGF